MTSLFKIISGDLGFREEDLRGWIREDRFKIKHARIPKNSGGYRTLKIPPRSAKLIQYWIIRNILRAVPVSPAATAYKPGSSIRDNAKKHKKRDYFVRLDIKDFFSSVHKSDFFEKLRRVDSPKLANLLGKSEGDQELEIALFPPDGYCGMGYPVSPYISNIVMQDFDNRIFDWLSSNEDRFGKGSYTRYADDICISIENKGFGKEVLSGVKGILEDLERPNLSLNQEKTKFGSRPGGTAQVTGLRVTKDGRITLHRKYKDHVRLLLSLASKGMLSKEELPSLEGHLNYCRSVDPAFYTKIKTKFFNTILNLSST